MPGWLKAITAHAFLCILLLPIALMPKPSLGAPHVVSGASGLVLFAAMAAALFMGAAGTLFLLRRPSGRHLYLLGFACALIGAPGPVPPVTAVIVAAVGVCLGVYLFRNVRVRAYFHLPLPSEPATSA